MPPKKPPSNITPLRPRKGTKTPPRPTTPPSPTPPAASATTTTTVRRRRPGQRLTETERDTAKATFLAAFQENGNVRVSAALVGVDRNAVYRWRDADEAFAFAMAQAEVEVQDVLEHEALRRAVHGTEKPVTSVGKLVYHETPILNDDGTPRYDKAGRPMMVRGDPVTVREYSDTLLVKMLAARHPRYKNLTQRVELSGPDGAPIQSESRNANLITLDVRTLSAEQLALLGGILEATVAHGE